MSKFSGNRLLQSFLNGRNLRFRKYFLDNPATKELLPRVRVNRDSAQFWQFIKHKFGTYAERRSFMWKEMNPLLEYCESKQVFPAEKSIIEVLQKFDICYRATSLPWNRGWAAASVRVRTCCGALAALRNCTARWGELLSEKIKSVLNVIFPNIAFQNWTELDFKIFCFECVYSIYQFRNFLFIQSPYVMEQISSISHVSHGQTGPVQISGNHVF